MLSIYICDDEKEMQNQMAREVKRQILIGNYHMEIRMCTQDPMELLEEIQKNPGRGIYFLDVDLKRKDMDGFLLGKEIRKYDTRGFIIYVTSYEDLAFKTFQYHLEALDFIGKGNSLEMIAAIRECLKVVVKRMKEEEREVDQRYFTVKLVDTVKHIPVSDILCFETASRTHRILLHAKGARIDFIGKLSEIQEQLGEPFFRSHRSFLVNLDKVKELDRKNNEIIMENGQVCMLSRTLKADLMEKLKQKDNL